MNVDLSTVSTAADLVFGVGDPLAEVVQIDCQASAAEDLHRDVFALHALLHRQYRVPVHSIVLLLRPKARHPNTTGRIEYTTADRRGTMRFDYEAIEVWRRPADEYLTGPLGVAPVAVLGRLPAGTSVTDGLAEVLGRLVRRVDREAAPGEAQRLATAAFVLSGLRIGQRAARQLLRGLPDMRESSTYQLILNEGRVLGKAEGKAEGAAKLRTVILDLGRRKFGEPTGEQAKQIRGCADLDRLERWATGLLDAPGWDEVLAVH